MSPPRVELLWWEGCPSWPQAAEQLREALAAAGADPNAVELHEIVTDEDAAREGFIGSPTIRIDGEDVFPPGEGEPVGLSCRIYHLRDGRVSPTPDPGALTELVRKKFEERSAA